MPLSVFVEHQDATYTEEVNRRGATQREFDYFGKAARHQFGPEAFLVDYGPERTTTPHFHSVDQFQVFFGAPGARYQRHPIADIELHYADAFVTYGPFSAAENPMRFFTLRARQGQYKGEMPSERHKLRYQGRRTFHVTLDPHLAQQPAQGTTTTTDLIEPQGDGLAASLVVAGPHTDIVLPATTTGGSYLCLLAGEIDGDGSRLGPMSLGWRAPTDDRPTLRTTDRPVHWLLALTFPFPATPDAHDLSHGVTTPGADGRQVR